MNHLTEVFCQRRWKESSNTRSVCQVKQPAVPYCTLLYPMLQQPFGSWLWLSSVSSKAVICTLKCQQLDICRLALTFQWLSLQLELCQPSVRIIKPMGAAGLLWAHLCELKFPQGSSQSWCICGLKPPKISPCLCQQPRQKRQHRGDLGASEKDASLEHYVPLGKMKTGMRICLSSTSYIITTITRCH